MILVVAELTMPLIGFLGLKEIYEGKIAKPDFLRAFKWATGITAGICLFFLIFGRGIFNFSGAVDQQLGWPKELIDVLKRDRQHMLTNDSLRSLFFVLAGAGIVYAFFIKKIKPSYFLLSLGLLITIDMWVVNKRYMNNDGFVNKRMVEAPFTPTDADKQILADKSPDFRVFNLTVSPFNDASTSFYHKSIGGYHGAKLRRYQDLIDYHLSKGNMAVLNMLNTKYFIQPGQNGPIALPNPDALGNVWFVDSIKLVNNPDEEIQALYNFNPKTTAIVDKKFESLLADFKPDNSGAGNIELVEYAPNMLKYHSISNQPKLAVFSEIYYPKGWKASIDGKPAPHFRANYVLRAMIVPAGEHRIEFTFDPPMWRVGKSIDLTSSLLLILIFVGWIGWSAFSKKSI